MTLEEKAKNFVDHCQAVVTSEGNLYSEAAVYSAYLAGAQEALAGQWRKIDEECSIVPPKDAVCLCQYSDGGYAIAIFDGVDEWNDPSNGETYLSPMWNVIDGDYVIGDEITHWMPIPELPKTDNHV